MEKVCGDGGTDFAGASVIEGMSSSRRKNGRSEEYIPVYEALSHCQKHCAGMFFARKQ